MKKKISNINKDLIKRKKFIKNEIKMKILKSIMQNLNIKPHIRALALKKICFFRKKTFLSNQNNNICLKTGRFKGVIKLTQMTRHTNKKLGLVGSLQNIKIKAW